MAVARKRNYKRITARKKGFSRGSIPRLALPHKRTEKNKRMVIYMAKTVKLQGIHGEQKGTPTKDLKIGDIIIWNFGYKSEVVEITPSKTGKTITFMLKSLESGNINPRKMGADRLVVIEEKKQEEPQNEVEKAIRSRKETYRGIYSDIGTVLDKFSTEELAKYYLEKFGDGGLRYFLEQQIIASEISREKAM